jgi:hypothetical protein
MIDFRSSASLAVRLSSSAVYSRVSAEALVSREHVSEGIAHVRIAVIVSHEPGHVALGRPLLRRSPTIIATNKLPSSIVLPGSGRAPVVRVRIEAIIGVILSRTRQTNIFTKSQFVNNLHQATMFTKLQLNKGYGLLDEILKNKLNY